jgi:hypothetical protein
VEYLIVPQSMSILLALLANIRIASQGKHSSLFCLPPPTVSDKEKKSFATLNISVNVLTSFLVTDGAAK